MTFGENLKNLRESKKLSWQQIADKFNVDLKTVMEWENNQTMPNAENLIELSKFYNVYLEELLGEKEDTNITDYSLIQRNSIFFTIVFQAATLAWCAISIKEGQNWIIVNIILALVISFLMLSNLKLEKNIKQRIKNIKIESCYLFIQITILVTGLLTPFHVASVYLMIFITLIYTLLINPKYMNRPLVAQKKKQK